MLNNKKIFFYSVFVLNIIFFIKSADMEIDSDDINDPTKKMRSESTPMDVDIEDAQDDCAIKELQLNGLFITREQYESMKKYGLVPSFPDDLEYAPIDDFPVSDNLDTLINGEGILGDNSLDHNGSDDMVCDWALPSNGLVLPFPDNSEYAPIGDFPVSETLDIPVNGDDVSDDDIEILTDAMSNRLELTNDQMKSLNKLIKKVNDSKKLTGEEKKLFRSFFSYGCNSQKYRNLLFEEIPGTKHSYNFKNGEGTISAIKFEGNGEKNELICECGIVVTTATVAHHMINHSKLREAIGYKKCPICKTPFYSSPDRMEKHIKDWHTL